MSDTSVGRPITIAEGPDRGYASECDDCEFSACEDDGQPDLIPICTIEDASKCPEPADPADDQGGAAMGYIKWAKVPIAEWEAKYGPVDQDRVVQMARQLSSGPLVRAQLEALADGYVLELETVREDEHHERATR